MRTLFFKKVTVTGKYYREETNNDIFNGNKTDQTDPQIINIQNQLEKNVLLNGPYNGYHLYKYHM